MRLILLTTFLLLALTPAARAGDTCTCQYFGQHLKLGTTICMKSWKGQRIVTCGMTLNNTAWKISDTPCNQVAAKSPARDNASVAVATLEKLLNK
ncbi:MAG: hypothetical protein VW169_11980 [Rhodospirillaceae bacterium]